MLNPSTGGPSCGGPVEDEARQGLKINLEGALSVPSGWREILSSEMEKPYLQDLQDFLFTERQTHTIYPREDEVFAALELTPFDRVKVLLLGQDPYHGPEQAHGLCFSVKPGVKIPASLRNIYKELKEDLGCSAPNHGYLRHWAEQGVLMLNAVLTVREAEPASHANRGWELFTDSVIRALNDRVDPVVFVLWGNYAQKKAKLISEERHAVLCAAHPSPLSVRKFYGSRPFSSVNRALSANGKASIDWQLPDV